MNKMKRALRAALIAAFCVPSPAFSQTHDHGAAAPVFCRGGLGVLLLAHGSHGAGDWNRSVAEIHATLAKKYTIALSLGMADGAALQSGIDQLLACRPSKILVIPLFASSHSSLLDHTAYQLGAASQPSDDYLAALARPETRQRWESIGMPEMFERTQQAARIRVKSPVAIELAQALDADPLAAEILVDRVAKMSSSPKDEAVILIAHGPNDDYHLAGWKNSLNELGAAVKARLGLRDVRGGLLLDDAPPEIRKAAWAALRASVEELSHDGPVLVIPYLLAQGGVESRLREALTGLDYHWTGETLAPDALLSAWVEKRIAEAAH